MMSTTSLIVVLMEPQGSTLRICMSMMVDHALTVVTQLLRCSRKIPARCYEKPDRGSESQQKEKLPPQLVDELGSKTWILWMVMRSQIS